MTALGSKSTTSAAIRESTRSGLNEAIVRTPDRPAIKPAQVDSTSGPSAVTAPMPVTTTRRMPFEPFERWPDVIGPSGRPGSSHELPRSDGRRAVHVAGQASGRDRARDRQHVELGPLDLGAHLAVVKGDERPGRSRVAVEDPAGRAAVDDDLEAELADLGDVGVPAADDPRV